MTSGEVLTREMTQVLRLQWLASRWLLVPLVMLCFGVPQAVVRTALRYTPTGVGYGPGVLLQQMQMLSGIFPFLAAISGAAVALAAWNWDHRTGHIYALSLPMPRARYALLKLWAGALILLVPAFATWLGAWVATSSVAIPDGLRAYPFAFGARFLLAGVIVYATMFALAAGTIRTTLIICIGFLAIVIGGGIAAPLVERAFHIDLMTPLQLILETVARWPGPFEVFVGNWLLIDV